MKLKKREIRRAQSYDYGVKARKAHLSQVHPDGNVDCVCEQSVWFFRKRKSVSCNCRRRKHGQPKRGVGVCYGYGAPREYMKLRVEGNRSTKLWKKLLNSGIDADDIEL